MIWTLLSSLKVFSALLCSVALYVEGVGAAVGAGALEAGHQSQVAGGDLGHDVGEDHGVIPAVAPGHEADPVAAHILKNVYNQ